LTVWTGCFQKGQVQAVCSRKGQEWRGRFANVDRNGQDAPGRGRNGEEDSQMWIGMDRMLQEGQARTVCSRKEQNWKGGFACEQLLIGLSRGRNGFLAPGKARKGKDAPGRDRNGQDALGRGRNGQDALGRDRMDRMLQECGMNEKGMFQNRGNFGQGAQTRGGI
jgi:hypothetical protein